MDRYTNLIDRHVTSGRAGEAYPGGANHSSPFAGGVRVLRLPGEPEAAGPPDASSQLVSSPFTEAMLDGQGSETEAAFTALAAELEDEEFDEAIQALVDEAAGRHLASAGVWSSEATAHLAHGDVEAWMAGIAAEADGLLHQLEVHFGDRTPESLVEGEIEAVLNEALVEQGRPGLESEDFIGALARKARSLVKGAAKLARRGVAAASRHLLGPLFGMLRSLVRPLLQRVLQVALNKLPPQLQGHAAALAAKLGVVLPAAAGAGPVASEPPPAAPADSAPAADPGIEPPAAGAALGEVFDAQLALAVVSEDESVAEEVASGWESGAPTAAEDEGPVAWLDDARYTLAEQLADAPPGAVLTSEVEQFVPAVMAAMPLIRTGIGMLGRDKVVDFIAKPLAALIKGKVGPEATKALSRAIADKGLQLLRLEAEAGSGGQLGPEALVSTLEDTIRAVGQLPPESQTDPLRVQAEVQEAFAEAAARHLPRELLRADLDTHEMEGESPVWVLMPRGPGRNYRYRKCSTIFPARIGRHTARAVVLEDGGTLEQRFLDEGATAWPVEAALHLYETLPGTHLGHLAASEGEGQIAGPIDTSQFERLTPQTASLLLNQPGAGRSPNATSGGGSRYYRVVTPRKAAPRRHRAKRAVVRLVVTGTRPVLRVHVRLSEREAHRVGELLDQRADVRLVAKFRALILRLSEHALPPRIASQAQRTPGVTMSPEQARALAAKVGEPMVTALSAKLRELAPALGAATRDPAPGVTLTFEFRFADRAALTAARPDAPSVTVRPGRHND